jgi:hypothetical protein
MSIESMLNPDPFEDLEVAARLADNEKPGHDSGARKLWPIPLSGRAQTFIVRGRG